MGISDSLNRCRSSHIDMKGRKVSGVKEMTTDSRMFLNQVQLWQTQDIFSQLTTRFWQESYIFRLSKLYFPCLTLCFEKKTVLLATWQQQRLLWGCLHFLFFIIITFKDICPWSFSPSVIRIPQSLSYCFYIIRISLTPSLFLSFRYIYYFGGLLSGAIKMNSSPLFLHQVLIPSLPNFQGEGGVTVCLYCQIRQKIHTSACIDILPTWSEIQIHNCRLYIQSTLKENILTVEMAMHWRNLCTV